MKKLAYFVFFLFTGLIFAACSDDTDENTNGNNSNAVKTGKVTFFYDIMVVSQIKVVASGGGSAGIRRPSTSSSAPSSYRTAYQYFEGDNLSSNKTITVTTSNWTTTLK